MGKWRQPKKSNKKAWKLIESGDIWWDKKAIDRAAFRRLQLRYQTKAHGKAYKKRKAEIAAGIQGMDYPAQMFYPFQMIKKGRNSF
jgi:hypothetical protein